MVELILLTLLIFVGVLWFRNLSDNSDNTTEDTEGNKKVNKWGTYISIIIVSGFFIWLLITNGKLN